MPTPNELFKKGYELLAQLSSEIIKELRKDKKDIIKKSNEIKNEVSKTGEYSDKIIEELKNKNVTVENAGEIKNEIVSKLEELSGIFKKELIKLDKDIIINTDLEPILNSLQEDGKNRKKENSDIIKQFKNIAEAISNVQSSVNNKEFTDYTLILDDIAIALENLNAKDVNIDLTKIETSLISIIEVLYQFKNFEIPQELLDGKRLKVSLSNEQLKKMGNSISVASGGGGRQGEIIDNQLNGSQKTQTVDHSGNDASDVFAKYQIADKDDDAEPNYFGFTDVSGNWYILKEENNTYRYDSGSSGYATAWSNRASGSYYYLYNVTIN